jgi:F0F1-type ATP synthase assembly protein I
VTPATSDGSQGEREQRLPAPQPTALEPSSTGRPSGERSADGQKSPDQLRTEIEQTRLQLGDTVQALAAKTDVKTQARDRIAALKEGAAHKKAELVSRAKAATPESADAGGKQLVSTAQSNPVPAAALAGAAAGLLIGWLIGRRRGT